MSGESSGIQEVSSLQKNSAHNWVEAGVWLDVVFVAMVAGSIMGLGYTFFSW